jgi:hypothetical protein
MAYSKEVHKRQPIRAERLYAYREYIYRCAGYYADCGTPHHGWLVTELVYSATRRPEDVRF